MHMHNTRRTLVVLLLAMHIMHSTTSLHSMHIMYPTDVIMHNTRTTHKIQNKIVLDFAGSGQAAREHLASTYDSNRYIQLVLVDIFDTSTRLLT